MGDESLGFLLGSDVGGTFTDLWVEASDGRTGVFKSPTTPDVIGGIVAALELAAEHFGLEVDELCRRVNHFGHGSTVGLNALLTGRVPKTAVVTTEGFADTLTIGRLRRQTAGMAEHELTDYLLRDQWPPLVPRQRVYEVAERIDATGAVVKELHEQGLSEILERMVADEVEAVAVCTLWSTQNPQHEDRIRAFIAARLGDVSISVSHEVSPTVGEYGRMSTTAANASLKPVASRYMARLGEELRDRGCNVPPLMMTGGGGVVPTDYLSESPVVALLSGPTACVMGCGSLARGAGISDVLTIDIGGTSFDVGMIVGSRPLMTPEVTIGGADIRVPSVDVRSIGAGGGSIAQVRDGNLTVGPQSAGANPGPACYGRGGDRPTATDADLLLGFLNPDRFVGGRMRLDVEAATKAVQEKVAAPLGIGVTEAAWGIREVLDNRMADLLRQVTIERGYDPREFVMFANGGGGPSHAWFLARELGVPEFVVPAPATGLSAFGTAVSDFTVAAERAVYLRLGADEAPGEDDLGRISEQLEDASAEVRRDLEGQPHAGEVELLHHIAMRYRGQANHLDVPLAGAPLDAAGFAVAVERFEEQYESLFGKGAAFREAGIEVLSVRTLGTAPISRPRQKPVGEAFEAVGSRPVVFDDPTAPAETRTYIVSFPAAGQEVEGPAVIEYPGQTAVVPPGSTARTDEFGSLIVRSQG